MAAAAPPRPIYRGRAPEGSPERPAPGAQAMFDRFHQALRVRGMRAQSWIAPFAHDFEFFVHTSVTPSHQLDLHRRARRSNSCAIAGGLTTPAGPFQAGSV